MEQITITSIKIKPALRYLIYAICGACMAIAYSVNALWFLSWIAFIPVLVLEYSFDNKCKHPYFSAYLRGLCFFYPYGIVVFFWFSEMYPLDFLGISKGAALCVVLLGILGLSLLQAVVWSFFFCFLHFIRHRLKGPLTGFSLFLSPFLWVALEWVQTLTWAGVPWAKLALGQVKMRAVIQTSSLFGPYFISFLIIAFSSFFAFSIIHYITYRKFKKSLLFALVALLLFAADFSYGAFKISDNDNVGIPVNVSAVQGNIDSKEKWSNDIWFTVDTYSDLSRDAADQGAQIIIWPETAIPVDVFNNASLKSEIEEISSGTGCTLLVGAFTRTAGDQLENSILKVEPVDGFSEEYYVKRRLVPFGEFVPWREFIMTVVPPLNELTVIGDDLASGYGSQLIDTQYGKIGSIICFDSIYEDLARESVSDGARLLCVSTNDSWFGDSSAVYEHNAHSVLRAVENGRYVVRSANTGISSVISPTGEVLSSLDPLVKGQITEEVKMIDTVTLYTKIGNVMVGISFVVLLLCAVLSMIFFRRHKNGR